MKGKFPINKFNELQTPFYYYDLDVLRKTLEEISTESQKSDF
ncbi:MAG TPA: diaminopimelate decarboxylase, partial [Paludibacter sp.]|nr:diaminopimelate decarboxylase [Paludibacter sp.]